MPLHEFKRSGNGLYTRDDGAYCIERRYVGSAAIWLSFIILTGSCFLSLLCVALKHTCSLNRADIMTGSLSLIKDLSNYRLSLSLAQNAE